MKPPMTEKLMLHFSIGAHTLEKSELLSGINAFYDLEADCRQIISSKHVMVSDMADTALMAATWPST